TPRYHDSPLLVLRVRPASTVVYPLSLQTLFRSPGGEIRYITWDFNAQPFGEATEDADPAKALAVRQAAAHLLDREARSQEIYQRSEEHTSALQSRENLVCRLLLEKNTNRNALRT